MDIHELRHLIKAGFEVRYIKGKGPNAHLDDALIVRVTEKQLKEWQK